MLCALCVCMCVCEWVHGVTANAESSWHYIRQLLLAVQVLVAVFMRTQSNTPVYSNNSFTFSIATFESVYLCSM